MLFRSQWLDYINQLGDGRLWGILNGPRMVANGSQQHLRAAEIVIAVARYQVERGSAPKKLQELVPEYLAQLPNDPRTGRPFGYRVVTGGKDEINYRGNSQFWPSNETHAKAGQALLWSRESHWDWYAVPVWTK